MPALRAHYTACKIYTRSRPRPNVYTSSQISPPPIYFLLYLRAGGARVVAALVTTSNIDVGEGEVLTASIATEDVVGVRVGLDGSGDVLKDNVSDHDTVGGLTSWAAVEVILLDIQTVVGNAGEGDVLVGDVGDGTVGARVGLDAHAVLRVGDDGVLEGDGIDGVVGLATDGPDGQTVAAGAVQVRDGDLGARGDGHTVVLVVDGDVAQRYVVRGANIETITVVGGGGAIREGVGGIADGVVQDQVRYGKMLILVDVEEMRRPVLDVQVLDSGVRGAGDDKEVVGLGGTSVGALAVPVGGAVTVNHGTLGTADGDVVTRDDDSVKVLIGRVAEGGGAGEDHGRGGLQARQVQRGRRRDAEVVQDDVGARCDGAGDVGGVGDGTGGPTVTADGGAGSCGCWSSGHASRAGRGSSACLRKAGRAGGRAGGHEGDGGR